MIQGCLFPAWRASFVDKSAHAGAAGAAGGAAGEGGSGGLIVATSMSGGLPSPSPGSGSFSRPLLLPQLDLSSLQPRAGDGADGGPPSESILKRQKFALYEKHCSKVAEGLYVSGEYVAKSLETLRANGITHVVNCVGALYPEYFASEGLQYKTLWLQDSPSEDLLCILYETFEFIDVARGGVPAGPGPYSGGVAADGGRTTRSLLTPRHGSRPSSGGGSRPHRGDHFLSRTTSMPVQPTVLPLRRTSGGGGSGSAHVFGDDACIAAGSMVPQLASTAEEPAVEGQACRQQQGADGAAEPGAPAGTQPASPPSPSPPPPPQQQQPQQPGVLVHCSQGVSRSTSIAIGYLMWATGQSYEDAYAAVRELRGVASPNIGFACQLLQWHKRRLRAPSRLRMYRLAPHCPEDPMFLVPRAVQAPRGASHPDWRALDPRGCFVLHLPERVYVWRGAQCLSGMVVAGCRVTALLRKYENAPEGVVVRQGEEPPELLDALGLGPGGDSNGMGGSATPEGGRGSTPDKQSCGGSPAPVSMQASFSNLPAEASPAAAAGGGSCGSREAEMEPADADAGALGEEGGSECPAACTAALTNQLSRQLSEQISFSQLAAREGGSGGGGGGGGASTAAVAAAVSEVDEYSADYELYHRACLRSADSSGRSTPRHLLGGLGLLVAPRVSQDDASARPESPATSEGRNRKYRRSEGLPQLGRLGGGAGAGTGGGGRAAGHGCLTLPPGFPMPGLGLPGSSPLAAPRRPSAETAASAAAAEGQEQDPQEGQPGPG